jgi:hypothetical protein
VHTFVLPPHVRVNTADRHLKSVRVVFEATITGGELRDEVGGTDRRGPSWFDLTRPSLICPE